MNCKGTLSNLRVSCKFETGEGDLVTVGCSFVAEDDEFKIDGCDIILIEDVEFWIEDGDFEGIFNCCLRMQLGDVGFGSDSCNSRSGSGNGFNEETHRCFFGREIVCITYNK